MNQLKNIISYFKLCYQIDNKGIHLSNFLGSKVENQIFLNQPDLIEGKLVQYPINTDWAVDVQKTLRLYAKEKELYCAAFFLLGKTKVLGKPQNICAPLLLFPLQLIREDEVFYLKLDSEFSIINPSFFERLRSQADDTLDVNNYIHDNIPDGLISFDAFFQLQQTLKKVFPSLDQSKLDEFPELFNGKQIKGLLKEITDWTIVPAAGVGIMKKSSVSRSVLDELDQLSKKQFFPIALQELFLQKTSQTNSKELPTFVPANLNQAQKGIIKSTDKHNTTLVVGPPGTGKSFTVASIAVDAISKGKSVLISAKSDQALEVIARKIEDDFGFSNLVLRGGKQNHKRILKTRISYLLSGIGVNKESQTDLKTLRSQIARISKKISFLESIIRKRELKEIRRGQHINNGKTGFLSKIKAPFLFWKFENELPFWEEVSELQNLMDKRNKLLNDYVKRQVSQNIYNVLRSYRESFQSLLVALRARTGVRKKAFFDNANFNKLLIAFPIWMVSTGEISRFLPLYKELFDLVIIDEATQCDIASAIPLLYRAKRSVIIGDPKQLRHVSFLSRQRQEFLKKSLELEEADHFLLNYRDNSVLDIVSSKIKSQDQVFFLDEHYRSLPDLIRFSNENFYDKSLKVMTLSPKTAEEKNIAVQVCNGKKEKRGFNAKEADLILDEISQIMEAEERFALQFCQTIGILSPFREQVNHIRRKAEKRFSLIQMERHNLLIGTPYSFQGEERDVMYISFTFDSNTHPSVYQYLNREDVFNVSITRARSTQKIFLSTAVENINSRYLVSKYLSFVTNGNPALPPIQPVTSYSEDQFLNEVTKTLRNMGVENIYKDYHIGGTEIDLLCIHNDQTVSIDLVGFPGAYENTFNFERYKMLFRVNIRIIVLPYSAWVKQRDRCVEVLRQSFKLNS